MSVTLLLNIRPFSLFSTAGGTEKKVNLVYLDESRAYIALSDKVFSKNYSYVINDGKWHHVAVSWDNAGTGELEFYIDTVYATGAINLGYYRSTDLPPL